MNNLSETFDTSIRQVHVYSLWTHFFMYVRRTIAQPQICAQRKPFVIKKKVSLKIFNIKNRTVFCNPNYTRGQCHIIRVENIRFLLARKSARCHLLLSTARTRQTVRRMYSLYQGDQLNMAVCLWYLVKSNLSKLHVHCSVHWTNHFLQGTRKVE